MQTVSLIAAAAIASFMGVASANAMAVPAGVATGGTITLVSGGCGYDGHRTPRGFCAPNGRPVYRACPPGFHLGPYGRRCFPNR